MGIGSMVAVACGGAAGACGRYAISQWASATPLGKSFFYGTLIANVFGCVLIGVMFGLLERGWLDIIPGKDLVAASFCGALTTFSTFSMETFTALRNGEIGKGVANLVLSTVLCLMGVAFGVHLAS